MKQELTKAPTILLTNPRIGEQLFQFEPHEVRRILVGKYEVRYELRGGFTHHDQPSFQEGLMIIDQ